MLGKVHHIGYAVANLESAIEQFVKFGYVVSENAVTFDELRGIKICFLNKTENNYCVELVAPMTANNQIVNILKKNGPTPYHLCYEVKDIDAEIIELRSQGFLPISKILPAIAIADKNVVFLYNKIIGIIELVEESKI